jgi:hypothetical protein
MESMMETKNRTGWMTVMVVVSVLVAVAFIAWLVLSAARIF